MPRKDHSLYTIFDTVAEMVRGPVILGINDLAATRAFAQGILEGDLKVNAEDYRLLRIGTISDFGEITPEDPATIVTGAEVLETYRQRMKGGSE